MPRPRDQEQRQLRAPPPPQPQRPPGGVHLSPPRQVRRPRAPAAAGADAVARAGGADLAAAIDVLRCVLSGDPEALWVAPLRPEPPAWALARGCASPPLPVAPPQPPRAPSTPPRRADSRSGEYRQQQQPQGTGARPSPGCSSPPPVPRMTVPAQPALLDACAAPGSSPRRGPLPLSPPAVGGAVFGSPGQRSAASASRRTEGSPEPRRSPPRPTCPPTMPGCRPPPPAAPVLPGSPPRPRAADAAELRPCPLPPPSVHKDRVRLLCEPLLLPRRGAALPPS
eukprot:TRINITY_DN11949_c0_g1_i7.p2 TRINITY_DN11949_c0_g1~~TRINITY_DN11949_c0_g1_i7.p2  ORF type:complete len:305 (+),score=49.06 TRINITY_DN11949_c0_g1_i7:72-917(+)